MEFREITLAFLPVFCDLLCAKGDILDLLTFSFCGA